MMRTRSCKLIQSKVHQSICTPQATCHETKDCLQGWFRSGHEVLGFQPPSLLGCCCWVNFQSWSKLTLHLHKNSTFSEGTLLFILGKNYSWVALKSNIYGKEKVSHRWEIWERSTVHVVPQLYSSLFWSSTELWTLASCRIWCALISKACIWK